MEIIEPLEEVTESKTLIIIKKTFTILIALFLIFIVSTYIIPGSQILDIIEGKLVSKELDNNLSIIQKDKTIIFNKETYEELLQIYYTNQIHEFKVCIKGTLNNNIFYLNQIERPFIIAQNIFSVTSEPCSKETLVSLHSHPENHCIPSKQDIKSNKKFQENNPDSISGIMCSKNRFNFY